MIGKPEPLRKIAVSRKLDGSLLMTIDGADPMTLPPAQAFKLAAGIFKGLGIELEYTWEGHGRQH